MLEAAREVDNVYNIDLSSETLSRVFPVFEAIFSEYLGASWQHEKDDQQGKGASTAQERTRLQLSSSAASFHSCSRISTKAADMVRVEESCASEHEVRLHACHQADGTISTRRDLRSESIRRRLVRSAHAQSCIPPAMRAGL